VNAGESGTLLRFILSVLSLVDGPVTVNGKGTLLDRPNKQIVDVLKAWGVDIEGRGKEHALPIQLEADGHLSGGTARVAGGVTSQVISSLLIAASFADQDITLRLSEKLVSRPYVDITMDVLKWSGIEVERRGYSVFKVKCGQPFRPKGDYVVHGDYSSAAFPLAAAALLESDVTVGDLVKDCQGDSRIVQILKRMGAKVVRDTHLVRVKGSAELKGIDIDGRDIPDLVPIVATLGCFAKGKTRIRNIAHLAHKESNRLEKPAGELRKLGARISIGRDQLVIRKSELKGTRVSSCNDHRIAMSLAVAGLKVGGVSIAGSACIAKSYPRFVSDMRRLGASLKRV
jgi:3-phosphoshikimate 1-carboxyvinyltransferase